MRRKANPREEETIYTVFSVIGGITATLICLVLFSLVMTKIDFSGGLVLTGAKLATCVGSYFTAYFLALYKRRRGILIGFLSGTAIFLFYFVFGIFISSGMTLKGVISRLLAILICGIIGGVVGVNSKWKRY